MAASWFAYAYLTLFLAEQEGWNSAENGFPFPVDIKRQHEYMPWPGQVSYYNGFSGIKISLHNYKNITDLVIFDINGNITRTIPVLSPAVTWDFTDGHGKDSPAGIYILQFMGINQKNHFNHLIHVLQ